MRDHNKPSQGGGDTCEAPLSSASVLKFEREEVLQYVHEMCASLSYMSRAHQCDTLAGLLQAAADEARLLRSTGSSHHSCEVYYRSERSDTR